MFEHKIIKELKHLKPTGLKGEIFLQSLNNHEIFARLNNLEAPMSYTCEKTWQLFDQTIIVTNYESSFVLPSEEHYDPDQEEVFFINQKDETIDIEPLIREAIQLNEPIIKISPDYLKQHENEPTVDDEDIDYFESHDTVIFK